MRFDEYKDCAEKHLKTIDGILKKYEGHEDELDSNPPLLIDIYYLCGYIIEGIVVYIAYKLSSWNNTRDIDDDKWYCCNNVAEAQRMMNEIITNGFTFNKESRQIPNSPRPIYYLSGHLWPLIVRNVLQNSFAIQVQDIPYIDPNTPLGNRTCTILLDNWNTKIRYQRDLIIRDRYGREIRPLLLLNARTIFELYNTCKDIYDKTIKV